MKGGATIRLPNNYLISVGCEKSDYPWEKNVYETKKDGGKERREPKKLDLTEAFHGLNKLNQIKLILPIKRIE